jgi:hypothetical protein
MIRIEVLLAKDRHREGTLTVEDGRVFRCLGISDSTAAQAHGNPARDPRKPYGDIPTGEYHASRQAPKNGNAADIRTYGDGVVFSLTPISGDALIGAANGRDGILIHGGATGAPMPSNALRPTHGCLRVDDSTIDIISGLCGGAGFTVNISEAGSEIVDSDDKRSATAETGEAAV